jgi:hypothetical protein
MTNWAGKHATSAEENSLPGEWVVGNLATRGLDKGQWRAGSPLRKRKKN